MFFFNRYLRNVEKINSSTRKTNKNVRTVVKRRSGPFFRNTNRLLEYKLISKDQAKNMIESNEALVIDVRTKEEYDKMHIKNAVNIPYEDIETTIGQNAFEKKTNIIVYCSTGTRSKIAIKMLNDLGYKNVYIWEYGALTTFPFKSLIIST